LKVWKNIAAPPQFRNADFDARHFRIPNRSFTRFMSKIATAKAS
jgi:hypothetical protein